MDRKIILGILGVALISLALAILLPGGRTVDDNPRLPWLIGIDSEGFLSVFDITLGRDTLTDVRATLQEQGVVNLFVSPQQTYTVEAYFQGLYLSGIRADLVVTLDLEDSRLRAMYERGLRISQLESGAKKVTLSEPDLAALAAVPVDHLTYLPATDLDAQLISGRFGEPARRIAEDSGIQHWLYPAKGLDIALNPQGKEVFQYVSPKDFGRLLAPLTTGPVTDQWGDD